MAKKLSPKPTPAPELAALKQGNQRAVRALARRDAANQQRETALTKHAKKLGALGVAALAVPPLSPAKLAALGSPLSAGTLIAEGDSWFDYPLNDVLTMLEDEHGYEVESVAHKGDPVESMAYREGQLDNFIRRIDTVLRRNTVPKAVLLSGGGNDIAGDEFYMLLNDARSTQPGLNAKVVEGVLERVGLAYVAILGAVTRICEERIGHAIPIVLHGYDYAVPDGRGFLGGFGPLPGPWLAPGFRAKGYQSATQCKQLVASLIDQFNIQLQAIAGQSAFKNHVRYIDLRGTLSAGPDYKKWWSNELHPSPVGFSRVAALFAAVI